MRSHGLSGTNWSSHNAYHSDANGNVTALVNSSGVLQASYKYNPYGGLISSSGSLGTANTMRFSSKPAIFSSTGWWGFYYYGYRFYDPGMQRWLNRDPMGEVGFQLGRKRGVSLTGSTSHSYAFLRNAPYQNVDPLGLSPLNYIGVDGHCCNKSEGREYALVNHSWVALEPGECTKGGLDAIDDDCDGMTCNGKFVYIDDTETGTCKDDSVTGPKGCAAREWTPGVLSGPVRQPFLGTFGTPHRGAADFPPQYAPPM